MEAPPLSRRDRERRERRQAMLDAARAVFAEKGYEQATLDEVAERAEFGKGTLYNYFEGGKEGILAALVEDVFDGMEQIVETHVQDTHATLQTRFHALLTGLIAYFEQNRDTFLLLVKEVQPLMLSPGHAVARLVHARDAALVERIRGPIEQAIEAGELRALPPEAVARMLFGNTEGLLLHHYCAPDAAVREAPLPAGEIASFVTTVLFEGLHPRP
ncbi:MAG: TetR/AcrR family transcriptional regulator [Rubricoccaceae bacterium]